MTELKSWVESDTLQGIAAIVAIGEAAVGVMMFIRSTPRPNPRAAMRDTIHSPVPPSLPDGFSSRLAAALGAVLFLVLGWIVFSIPWSILALSMGYRPEIVLSFLFFILGASAALGALLTRHPAVGGFLGGGLPFGILALYYFSINPNMKDVAPSPLTWFAVFAIIGGLIGALTALTLVSVMHLLRLPVPFR